MDRPSRLALVHTNAEARAQLAPWRRAGETVGLVPTMGYLHDGHRRLIEAARAGCDRVVVSLFVNPTQFGPNEDLARYPRDLERDLALCEAAGADVLYAPGVEQLYPHDPGMLVVPPEALTNTLCGAYRPGHFTGVATVVAKLFALLQPDRAYFGAKDFQQTVVIAHLIADLCFPVELVRVSTVREPDGLALSSRNVYLTSEERTRARVLSRALQAAWQAGRAPNADSKTVLSAARSVLAEDPSVEVQYLEAVDAETLAPAADLARPVVVALAAYVGRTRLIDNVALDGPAPLELSLTQA